jgi:c-di-GMP-binding flagellar brake protein YcgR
MLIHIIDSKWSVRMKEPFDEYENLDEIAARLGESTFREKRRYPRVDYIFDVKYEILPSPKEKEEILTKGKDISLGGVSFELRTEDDVKVGMFLIVRFSIQELAGELKAMGKVVRVWKQIDNENNIEKKYCAVKFTAIDPTDYDILNKFIKDYLSQKSD